jgi:hypothetical protein
MPSEENEEVDTRLRGMIFSMVMTIKAIPVMISSSWTGIKMDWMM